MSKLTRTIPSYLWLPAFGTLTIGYVTLNLAPASTQFMELFGVGHGSLAVFLSALMWSHAIAQIPAGLAADRFGVARSIHASIILLVLGNVVPFIMPSNLPLGVVCRLFTGLSTALLFLASVRALTLLAPPTRLVQAQGLQGSFFALGTMLPYVILPLFGAFAWMGSYLLCIVFAVIMLIFLHTADTATMNQKGTPASAAEVWHSVKKNGRAPLHLGAGVLSRFFLRLHDRNCQLAAGDSAR